MDLNSLSVFFRENNKNLHRDLWLILAYYKKFKITNSHLRTLKEIFFMEQVKKKLEDPQSNWDTDQVDALQKYKDEWEIYDKSQKRDITQLKKRLEIINKEYRKLKESHKTQVKLCNDFKNIIEELIESKTAFESVINLLLKEKETIDMYNKGKSLKKNMPVNKSNFSV
jgi:predicted  nucleic acid-binding Zn-ribbon protein